MWPTRSDMSLGPFLAQLHLSSDQNVNVGWFILLTQSAVWPWGSINIY